MSQNEKVLDNSGKSRGRPVGSTNKDKGGLTRYNPAKWEAWMTQLCIMSNAGYSNIELAKQFEISETHVSNLLCSDRASSIQTSLREKLIKAGSGEINELRSLASKRLKEFLEDDTLKTNAPIQFANTAARVLQMTFPSSGGSKEKGDVNVTINQQNNLQQNVLAVNPEYMQRIADGLEKSNRVEELHAGAFLVKDVDPKTGGDLVSPVGAEVRTLNKKVG